MYELLKKLYTIPRSITGDGVRKTLSIINKEVPLNFHEVPTGSKVLDWSIPNEWNVKDAWVKNSNGEKIISFKENNLHLVGYSIPFTGKVEFAELQKHLHSLETQPTAIPYITSYYNNNWGFCLTHNQRKNLTKDHYYVHIDTTLNHGNLTYADYLLKGKSKKEILFSTYICHPQMANNELSGPVVTCFLLKELLKRKKLKYSYRFVFIPETIGAITYISKNIETLKENVIGGYVVTCVGDPGNFSYLQSRAENTLTDRLTLKVLKKNTDNFNVYSYLSRGSDERQYCAPGIDLPIGSLMRTKYGEYPQYHTSLDNLDFVTSTALKETLTMYLKCIDEFEKTEILKTTVLGEPQLGKRGLYREISTKEGLDNKIMGIKNFLAYCDGKTENEHIASKIKMTMKELKPIIKILKEHKLAI